MSKDEDENTQEIDIKKTKENLASSVNFDNPNTSSISIIGNNNNDKNLSDNNEELDSSDSSFDSSPNVETKERKKAKSPFSKFGFSSGHKKPKKPIQTNKTSAERSSSASIPTHSISPTLANPTGRDFNSEQNSDKNENSETEETELEQQIFNSETEANEENSSSDDSVNTKEESSQNETEEKDEDSGEEDQLLSKNPASDNTQKNAAPTPMPTPVKHYDTPNTGFDGPTTSPEELEDTKSYSFQGSKVNDTAKISRLPRMQTRAATAPKLPIRKSQTNSNPSSSQAGQKTVNLVTVGNELITGYGDPKGQGWLGRVISKTLEQPYFSEEYTKLNNFPLAMPEENIDRLSKRWKDETERRFRALDKEELDNRLVIFLPHQDAKEATSSARSRLIFANILDTAIKSGYRPFVIGPPPSLDPSLNSLIAELNNGYADASSRRDVPYVNTFSPLLSHSQWQKDLAANDGVPGQAGHGLIAWLVLHRGWFEWLGIDEPQP